VSLRRTSQPAVALSPKATQWTSVAAATSAAISNASAATIRSI
jgi:hypothetical protein